MSDTWAADSLVGASLDEVSNADDVLGVVNSVLELLLNDTGAAMGVVNTAAELSFGRNVDTMAVLI